MAVSTSSTLPSLSFHCSPQKSHLILVTMLPSTQPKPAECLSAKIQIAALCVQQAWAPLGCGEGICICFAVPEGTEITLLSQRSVFSKNISAQKCWEGRKHPQIDIFHSGTHICLMTLIPVEIMVKEKINGFGAELVCHTTTGAVLLPVLKQLCKLVWHGEHPDAEPLSV